MEFFLGEKNRSGPTDSKIMKLSGYEKADFSNYHCIHTYIVNLTHNEEDPQNKKTIGCHILVLRWTGIPSSAVEK